MLALRRASDPAPELSPLPGFAVRCESDAQVMAALQGRTETDMTRRFGAGHRAYVAWLDGMPAAWGWVATRSAEIGEMSLAFSIEEGERYLWNFVTLKSHRGMGIYPRLLDAIVRAESSEAERFWIAYAPENHASGAGIYKAGFATMAELSFDPDGRPALHSRVEGAAPAGVRRALPEAPAALARCWRCARAKAHAGMTCSAGVCTCDYQRPEVECAA